MKKKRKDAVVSASSPFVLILLGPVFCAVTLLAHFVAGFFPHSRVWGINHLAYFPLSMRMILVMLPLLVFVPKVNRKISTLIEELTRWFYDHLLKHKKYLWYVAFSLLSFPLFWVLRAKTYFLGDGFHYVAYLNHGVEGSIWSELLESSLHVWWHKWLNLFFIVDAFLSYQLASIIAGMLFLFLLFLFSDYLGKNPFEKFFVFSILATMGSLQLFFGYVEHYSFACLCVLAYIFLALRFLDQQGKLFLVVLLFVLCLAFHFVTFYLAPSLAYLLSLDRERRVNKKRVWGLTAGMLVAAVLLLAYAFQYKPGILGILFLPLASKHALDYTLFSSEHLLDVLNQNLLVSPVGPILLSVSLLLSRKEQAFLNPSTIFLLMVVASQFLFHFLMNPGLGAARDWDLFSALSVGYTTLGLWLFLKTSPRFPGFKHLAAILIFASFFSTLPWIALNASESKSIQRFRDIMDLDPKKSRSGHFCLAQYFDQKGMIQEVEKENQKQSEVFPELVLLEEGAKYFNEGRLAEALDIFKQAEEMNPYLPDVHFCLGRMYYRQGNLDQAEKEYERAVQLRHEYAKAHIELAKIYAAKGSWKKSTREYKRVLKLGIKDPAVYSDLAKTHFYQNQFDQAIQNFEKAIQIEEDFVEAHLGLGTLLHKLNRWDEAILEYQKVIRLKPDSEYAYLALAQLYLSQGSKKKALETLERFLEFSTDSQKSEEVKKTIEGLKNQR